jgi:hypothetical protein
VARPAFSFVLLESSRSAGVHYIPKRRFWAFSLCLAGFVSCAKTGLELVLVLCIYVDGICKVMTDGLWTRKDISFLLHLIPFFGHFCNRVARVLCFLFLVVSSAVQVDIHMVVGIWSCCFLALVGLAVCIVYHAGFLTRSPALGIAVLGRAHQF